MADNLYEGMFLLDSSRFSADPDGTANKVLAILEKVGATVMASRPWLDGKLAYSVEGRRVGLYYLTYFKMTGPSVNDIALACKLSDVVLRHLIIRHPATLFEAMVQAVNGENASFPAAEVKELPKDAAEAKELPKEGDSDADANADEEVNPEDVNGETVETT